MPLPAEKSRGIRFGVFEVDVQEGELRKNGIRIKLHDQPFQILTLLLERPGQTVTREEIRQRLWPSDTFVDFDHSLNTSINKLREALGDTSENPRFIETLHRRGYRFIYPVEDSRFPIVEPAQSVAIPLAVMKTVPVPANSSDVAAPAKPHHWRLIAAGFAALMIVGGAGFGVYSLLHRPAPRPFQNFTVTQVTNSDKVTSAAISPDGRYVASVLSDQGMESLWLRNLRTGSDTQIIAPSAADYHTIRFSPDGDYIYFIMGKNANWDGYNLFRCPVLGGSLQLIARLLEDYDFSPDGQRIVFLRLHHPIALNYQILTASAVGGDERILQAGPCGDQQPFSFTWSPKPNEIYYALYSLAEGGLNAVDVLDLRTRKSHRFASFKDKGINSLLWRPDGRTLIVSYAGPGTNGSQIGFIPSSGGDIEPITRDANDYWGGTISADGKTISTVQARSPMTLSVLSRAGREFKKPHDLLAKPKNDVWSIMWSNDGDLLVKTATGLSKFGTDGKSQTLPLANASLGFWQIAPCGTDYLILSGGNPPNIWRTDADGSNLVKLTDGKYDANPVCSPDQKWVYYYDAAPQRIFRVPVDDSRPAEAIFDAPTNQFNQYFAGGLTVSPDGKTLAAPVTKPPGRVNLALYEIGSSRPPRLLDADIYSGGNSDLQSTNDGNSVAYVRRRDGVDNLWANPLDGSPAYPITDFKSDQIWAFSFSLDGKRLAIVHGHTESDVVLLKEIQK